MSTRVHWSLFLSVIISVVSGPPGLFGDVVINEFMASNGGTIMDEDGDFEDWIELFNRGDQPVNLEGWGLSDSGGDPFRWTFPDAVLMPGDYLLVWASGKDRKPSGEGEPGLSLAPDEVAGLAAWFAAEDLQGVEDGAQVAAWNDASGLGNHAAQETPSARPVFRASAVNGLPALEFNGSNQQFFLPHQSFAGMADFENFTLFAVARWNGKSISGIAGTGPSNDNSGNFHFEIGSGGDIRLRVGAMDSAAAANAVSPGEWTILGASQFTNEEDPVAAIYREGNIIGSRREGPGRVELAEYGGFFLGNSHNSNRHFDGLIAEVILYSHTLTSEERHGVVRYLKDRYNLAGPHLPVAPLHTNFRISATGESLLLTRPDGSRADEVAPTPVPRDVSHGRSPDGTGDWFFFLEPTPQGANVTQAYAAPLSAPEFSHERGFYDDSFELALTMAEEGASIYYTIDGSVPSESNGVLYTAPIPISTTTIVRAVGSRPGALPVREVATHSFMYVEDVMQQPFRPEGFPDAWGSWPLPHYLMEPEVVNNPDYNDRIRRTLTNLPSLSLALAGEDMFGAEDGIYAHPTQTGMSWERPTSAELIRTDGRAGFQIDAGIRIQGGASRQPNNEPKHSFSLRFRNLYGQGSLDYPLFDGSPVSSFDSLQFRAGFNNSWTHWAAAQRHRGDLIRDQWVRQSMIDMGHIDAGQGTFLHVFINGLYWGVYNVEERPSADHYARYWGGDKSDYDALNGGSPNDGNRTAFNEMKAAAASGNWVGLQELLDIDNYIDFQIINRFAGNLDLTDVQNWRAAGGGPGRALWRFYPWDAERTLESPTQNAIWPQGADFAGRTYDPEGLFQTLWTFGEFRIRFADRVQQHFFYGGRLTPEKNTTRLLAFADLLDDAVAAESARWGSYRRDVSCRTPPCLLYTRNSHWVPEINRLVTDYFPIRTANVLNQFRNAGFYPQTAAPVISPHGGTILNGVSVGITAPNGGSIYYTLDGLDPREPASGSISPSALAYNGTFLLQQDALLRARVLRNGEWSALNEAHFAVPRIAPHLLAEETFRFDYWDPASAAGTFPPHMLFEQSGQGDPALGAEMDGYWNLPYNLTSRSRINGLGDNGISFINTANAQEADGAGYLGSAVLALDTRDSDGIYLRWTGGTVTPNSRIYGLRLQYRLGATAEFQDLLDGAGNPIEYLRNDLSGHSRNFGPFRLPLELEERPYVELRWKYHYIAGDSGPRAELRLDNIFVTAGSAPAEAVFLPTVSAEWTDSFHWTSQLYPDGAGVAARVGAPAAGDRNIDLLAPVTVGHLAMDNGEGPYRNRIRDRSIGNTFTFQANDGVATFTVDGSGDGFAEFQVEAGVILAGDLRVSVDHLSPGTGSGFGGLRLRESWSGPGGLIKTGPGELSLTGGGKIYSGATVVEEGVLRVTEPATPTQTSGVSVFPGGQLRLTSGSGEEGPRVYSFGGDIRLSGSGRGEEIPSSSQQGILGALRYEPGSNGNDARVTNPVFADGDTHLHVDGTHNRLELSGTLNGQGPAIKSGGGTLVLSGGGAGYTGAMVVANGALEVNGDFSTTPVHLLPGSVLQGYGSVGSITGNGTVSPGPGATVLTAERTEPLSYTFRLRRVGPPDYSAPQNSGNGLLRLTAEDPFAGALNAGNSIRLFLEADSISEGDVYFGGFFTDSTEEFLPYIQSASWTVYVADEGGSVMHDGDPYALYTGAFPMTMETVTTAADFGQGAVEGRILRIGFGMIPAGFESWRRANFTEAEWADAAVSGPAADPGGTGLPNLLRYAIGLGRDEEDRERLPILRDAGEEMEFSFLMDPAKEDIIYVVRRSWDLMDWSEILYDSRIDQTAGPDEGWTRVAVPLEHGQGEISSRQFIRLEVRLVE